MKNEKIISQLQKRGIEFGFGYEYIGEGEERKRVDRLDQINNVYVKMEPREWCSLCMREGDDYIGGCCGQTGYTQDVLNELFRDGGCVSPRIAGSLTEVASGHDGFEVLTMDDEEELLATEAQWEELGPIDKIFLCVAASRPRMRFSPALRPSRYYDPADGLDVLIKPLQILRFTNLFEASNTANESGQSHGNIKMWLARALPASKLFTEKTSQQLQEPFFGFAIVDKDTNQIQQNGFGYTIYSKKETAESLLQDWVVENEEVGEARKNESISRFRVKAVTVSATGIEFES